MSLVLIMLSSTATIATLEGEDGVSSKENHTRPERPVHAELLAEDRKHLEALVTQRINRGGIQSWADVQAARSYLRLSEARVPEGLHATVDDSRSAIRDLLHHATTRVEVSRSRDKALVIRLWRRVVPWTIVLGVALFLFLREYPVGMASLLMWAILPFLTFITIIGSIRASWEVGAAFAKPGPTKLDGTPDWRYDSNRHYRGELAKAPRVIALILWGLFLLLTAAATGAYWFISLTGTGTHFIEPLQQPDWLSLPETATTLATLRGFVVTAAILIVSAVVITHLRYRRSTRLPGYAFDAQEKPRRERVRHGLRTVGAIVAWPVTSIREARELARIQRMSENASDSR